MKHFYFGTAYIVRKGDSFLEDLTQSFFGVEDLSKEDFRSKVRTDFEQVYPNSIIKVFSINEISLEDLEKAVKELKEI